MKKSTRTIVQILLFVAVILATIQVGQAQGVVNVSVQVDPKITINGDSDHDIESGFNNVLIKSRWTGNQQKFGYLYVAPSFEYARLSKDLPEYQRYAVEVGYTLNELFLEDLEMSLYIDYGILKRGLSKQGLGFGGVIGYEVFKGGKILATWQWVDRQDFEILYNIPSEFKYSVQVGFEIVVFGDYRYKNQKRR